MMFRDRVGNQSTIHPFWAGVGGVPWPELINDAAKCACHEASSSPGSREISDPRASQVTRPASAKSEPNDGRHGQARGVAAAVSYQEKRDRYRMTEPV